MYINFTKLKKLGIADSDVIYLIALRQKEEEFLSNWGDGKLTDAINLGWADLIKSGKKSDSVFSKARIGKKGKEILEALGEARVGEEDRQIWEWVSEHYKKRGKDAGAKGRTLDYIRDFRLQTNISRNKLVHLIATFLSDSKEMEYSNKAQNIFYKSDNVYSTKFNKEGSRLYAYYLRHQDFFSAEWTKEQYNR